MATHTTDCVFRLLRDGDTTGLDWKKFCARMRTDPELFSGRITPYAIQRQHDTGRSLILQVAEGTLPEWNGIPIAHVTLWPMPSKRWVELGTFHVIPEFRDRGLGGLIFSRCVQMIDENPGLSAFMVGNGDKLKHLAWKTNETFKHWYERTDLQAIQSILWKTNKSSKYWCERTDLQTIQSILWKINQPSNKRWCERTDLQAIQFILRLAYTRQDKTIDEEEVQVRLTRIRERNSSLFIRT